MGILNFFKSDTSAPEVDENTTIREIVKELNHLPQDQAKYLAAFAYILGRVANADLDISDEETKKMEEIVHGFTEITSDLSILIVQIAKSQNLLFGGTEDYLVVREFKEISNYHQREGLMHCLFAVAGADDEISNEENEEIRNISQELGFTNRDFIDVRTHYLDKLTLLKNLP